MELHLTCILQYHIIVEGGKFVGTRTKSHASHTSNNFLKHFCNWDRQLFKVVISGKYKNLNKITKI